MKNKQNNARHFLWRNFKAHFMLVLLLSIFAGACKKPVLEEMAPASSVKAPLTAPTLIYKPVEFGSMDYNNSSSTWSYSRSAQSTHFIVFWGAGYGTNHPNSSSVPAAYRVDITDLLNKAELFYAMNVDTLKFAKTGSKLETYKMMIFLHYTTDWMAYGGGYDDNVGALWVSPSTCQPVGSTIAHEIGHSFQYQVRADLGAGKGFRWGFGGGGGNGFWEQTAQWQASLSYPAEIFGSYHFNVYRENYHRHQIHEGYRYANYFVHYYWADKHNKEMISRIWRETNSPNDPIQGYMAINSLTTAQMNAEMYDMAKKFATWDIPALRTLGASKIGNHAYKFVPLGGNAFRVHYDFAPGTTGYNIVPLKLPTSGSTISTVFEGLPNFTGYNTVNASQAGWRFGYVAMNASGTRTYSPMYSHSTGTTTASFSVPTGTTQLFLVVTGAPTVYAAHPWDDNNANDAQWPYKVTLTNTGIKGYVTFSPGQLPASGAVTVNARIPNSATSYNKVTIHVDPEFFANAFVKQPSEITDLINSSGIQFVAIEPGGAHNATYTANGYGHWFNASGAVTNWGSTARFFSEFNQSSFSFDVGIYPGAVTTGQTAVIKQALKYTVGSSTYVATVNINVEVI